LTVWLIIFIKIKSPVFVPTIFPEKYTGTVFPLTKSAELFFNESDEFYKSPEFYLLNFADSDHTGTVNKDMP
jgi:hypothetical protein